MFRGPKLGLLARSGGIQLWCVNVRGAPNHLTVLVSSTSGWKPNSRFFMGVPMRVRKNEYGRWEPNVLKYPRNKVGHNLTYPLREIREISSGAGGSVLFKQRLVKTLIVDK